MPKNKKGQSTRRFASKKYLIEFERTEKAHTRGDFFFEGSARLKGWKKAEDKPRPGRAWFLWTGALGILPGGGRRLRTNHALEGHGSFGQEHWASCPVLEEG